MLQKIKIFFNRKTFNSKEYWEARYTSGGNSGSGSYGRLAVFKAQILNKFVSEKNVHTIIEFGCGDGNQLSMAEYPKYIGLDVSKAIIQTCIKKFQGDSKKSFFLYDQSCFQDNGKIFSSDVSMSLDVLYHLTEKEVYETYLKQLFSCALKFVIIYAPNVNIARSSPFSHEFYRKFSDDVERLAPEWELFEVIENEYKSQNRYEENCSIADFYFYRKKESN